LEHPAAPQFGCRIKSVELGEPTNIHAVSTGDLVEGLAAPYFVRLRTDLCHVNLIRPNPCYEFF
jgi:hypothetical protein